MTARGTPFVQITECACACMLHILALLQHKGDECLSVLGIVFKLVQIKPVTKYDSVPTDVTTETGVGLTHLWYCRAREPRNKTVHRAK